MPLQLEAGYLNDFVSQHEYEAIAPQVKTAHELLMSKTGMGNDFLGWVDLPTQYDKEEFARIKAAAEKIQEQFRRVCGHRHWRVLPGRPGCHRVSEVRQYTTTCARALPPFTSRATASAPPALSELVSICEGKDISINMISKSGTTTEPAIAFRVFRELLEKKYGKEGARGADFRHHRPGQGHSEAPGRRGGL